MKELAASLDIPVVALGFSSAGTGGLADLLFRLDCGEADQKRPDHRPVHVSVTRRGDPVGNLALLYWNKKLRFEES